MIIPISIVGGIVGLLILLLIALAVLGSRVPEEHVASMSLKLATSTPEQVWALIGDAAGYPAWAKGVTKVEKLPGRDGREAFRQTMGRNSFVLETTRSEPPRLLERTITDEHGPFNGSWTYQLTPDGAGCIIKLTERGHVKSAIPRAVMKHFMGYHLYLGKHLQSLAARLGEPADLREKTVG